MSTPAELRSPVLLAAPPTTRRGPVLTVAHAIRDTWNVLRFSIFLLYLLLAILSIWMWMVGAAVGVCRVGLRSAMLVLLRLSRGQSSEEYESLRVPQSWRNDLRALWNERLDVYRDVAERVAQQYVAWRNATRTFWHWTVGRKAVATILGTLFIGVPALFIVPRPHEVQITDDNAVHHEAGGERVRTVVHAIDLHDPDSTREYVNEDAWWLGKLDSHGLKSELKPGRYYRLWVVGLRWYHGPTLFPNIIGATEISEAGDPIEGRAKLLRQVPAP